MDWVLIILIAPFLIGGLGQGIKTAVLGHKPWPTAEGSDKPGSGFTGLRGVYWSTLFWHPWLAGTALGAAAFFTGVPIPDVFGQSLFGYMLAFTCAGGVASIAYNAIVKTLLRIIETFRF